MTAGKRNLIDRIARTCRRRPWLLWLCVVAWLAAGYLIGGPERHF